MSFFCFFLFFFFWCLTAVVKVQPTYVAFPSPTGEECVVERIMVGKLVNNKTNENGMGLGGGLIQRYLKFH